MSTVALLGTYELVTCCNDRCGLVFAMERAFKNQRLQDHRSWYCPHGHQQYFTAETEEEKLRRQVTDLRSTARWYNDQLNAANAEAAHQRRKAGAARGQLTKIKNRIANGVCPVAGCQRSFKNVLAHLRTVHPDYHQHEVDQ